MNQLYRKNSIGMTLTKDQFGEDFIWGVTNSAFQNEGAALQDGKSPSIWDTFVNESGKVANNDHPGESARFYTHYPDDFSMASELGFEAFRFSLPWSRIIPDVYGKANKQALTHYHKVIDACLAAGLAPNVTLYHWDLPQYLEDIGGWANRDIMDYFLDYTDLVTRNYGDKVKDWFVLNEPMSFTGLGYYKGYHAPGKKGINHFLPAVHHAVLAQAEGGRLVRANVKDAQVGTTFSCSAVTPYRNNRLCKNAARRVDALLNRLFIEPSLGMGYPYKTLPGLRYIERYFMPGDEQRMIFDFDVIGLQYYFRVVARFSLTMPVVFADEVPAVKRGVNKNVIGMEVYPKGLYKIVKQFSQYSGIKKIIITESGGAFPDKVSKDQSVNDKRRLRYHKNHLKQVLKAKRKGLKIGGYYVWTLVDNFEWSEGFSARFGLVYNDFITHERLIKKSGHWFRKFFTS